MPNADWMAGFSHRDDLYLTDITFPGSHDAGLQEAQGGYHGYTKVADSFSEDTICQFYDIAGQLEVGSRAFDLRIASKGGVLRTFHGEGNVLASNLGGWGQDAASIFQQTDQFLQEHPTEIVILRISHTDEADNVHRVVRQFIKRDRRFTQHRNLCFVPLSRLRGKAIVIFDRTALARPQPLNGLHGFGKYSKNPPWSDPLSLRICGEYAGQMAGTLTGNQKLREMAQLALSCGQEHGTHPTALGYNKHNHLFMIYWQLAWDVKAKTVNPDGQRDPALTRLDDMRGTHYNLDFLLNCYRGVNGMYHVTHNPKVGSKTRVTLQIAPGKRLRHRPNWINLDFVNDEVCGKVIEFNQDLLPP